MRAQQELIKTNWRHRYCHGGKLRNLTAGRGARPLSTKDPIHMVIKANCRVFRKPKTYAMILALMKRYSRRFYVKIEQLAVEHDHIHLLIRSSRRASLQSFFRVLSGQIAQRLTDTFTKRWPGPKVWKYRPFSRVLKGWKAYRIVRDYIQLNEKEACGEIPYQRQRLKGLTPEEIASLWE